MIESIKKNPWFRPLRHQSEVTLRIFCLPYAGGGSSIFRLWPDDLPPTIEVLPVQLPGRETRYLETPFMQLDPLIDSLADAVRPYLNIPYAIFGYSMGALIGFELARELRRRYGISPAHLFVAAYPAPKLPKPLPPLLHLPDAALLAELHRLQGTPREILENQELVDLFLPILRADFSITETYTYSPGAALNCPISAFGGLDDQFIDRRGLAAWGEQTSSFFTVHMFPGNHFFFHQKRESVLKVITKSLSSFTRRVPSEHERVIENKITG